MTSFRQTLCSVTLGTSVSLLAFVAAQAQAQAQSVELEQVTVSTSAETATGSVDGYIAELSRTGTKTDTPLSETPQSVTVIPADQIEDQDAESIAETFRYSAGVFSEYRGDSTVTDEAHIRGFEFVPIYVNGLDFGTNRLGSIDPYLLERVEILRGPSSVLYGQATPGGLINLVTKKANGNTGREVELSAGLDNQVGIGFDFQGVFDPDAVWSYRLVGKAERSDAEIDDIIEQSVLISPSLRWAPTADTALTLHAFYNHEPDAGYRNFRPAEGTLYAAQSGWIPADFNYSDPNIDESILTQSQTGYEFEHRFNDMFKFRQNVAYNIIDTSFTSVLRRNISGDTLYDANRGGTLSSNGSRRDTDINQFVIDNQLQSEFATGPLDHTLLTGVDYKYTKQNYNWNLATNLPNVDWTNPSYGGYTPNWRIRFADETTSQQLGIYAQDQVDFGNLHLSFGGRYDWAHTKFDAEYVNFAQSPSSQTYDDGAFTGRAGAIYNFDNGVSPYVSYSTSFEPSLQTNTLTGEVLDPSTGQQIEAGVKFAPASGRFQLIASVFQLYQQNVASTDPGTNITTATGEIRSRGVELEGRAMLTDNLSLIGALTFIDAEITKDEDPANVGLKPDMIPESTGSVWAKYEFLDGSLDGLALGLGVRYIGESTDTDNVLTVKSATLLDAMASYDFGKHTEMFEGVKLQVNGSNLLDRRYVSACSTSTACWLGQGRTVTAKLKFTW